IPATRPENGEGISTVALSVSTSSKGASSEMTSPSRIKTLTISASVRPSPRSGSANGRGIPQNARVSRAAATTRDTSGTFAFSRAKPPNGTSYAGTRSMGASGDRSSVGGHPREGRREREERAVHDRGGDLRAGAKAPGGLVDDDGAAGLLDRIHQRLPIERGDGEQVDHRGLDTVLFLEDVSGLEGDADHGAVRDEREGVALAHHLRAAERQGLALLGDLFLGGVIQGLRLEKDDRVGVADGGGEQCPRVARARWDDHLQPGNVGVELLLGLGVVLERAHAASVRHADHHRDVEAALRAGAVARAVVLDLVEALKGEAGELDLADRLEAVEGHADRGADDGRLGQRAVDDALGAALPLPVVGHPEDAAVDADVLAQHEHVAVTLHLLEEPEVEGLDHVQLGHGVSASSSAGPAWAW